ncbi:hypothetical protein [Microbacterium sp. CIAB417]|uniref:hypothetical protein n=1 Tax=Microbacterium sp. CIAB417 TaxID=2860287 RepID=UPI001FAC19A4|nr:hypothetical protein [Microbacterium sp. CIAB417]
MSPSDDRQRVVRVQGARRARLTPAPGAVEAPEGADDDAASASETGPNDERMRREVPPHY